MIYYVMPLIDMNKRLKVGSKVCFLDYDKFLDIIPNIDWLSDDKKIKKIFYILKPGKAS